MNEARLPAGPGAIGNGVEHACSSASEIANQSVCICMHSETISDADDLDIHMGRCPELPRLKTVIA